LKRFVLPLRDTMNCQSTPLSVSLLSAWFFCVLSTRQSRIKLYLPQIQIKEKARLRSPLLHGWSGEAPVPNVLDPYCMGHHLCWHCLGPPLSKLFAGILFLCPVQYSMGVAGTPSCLKSIRNQLPKRLLLFSPTTACLPP